MSIERMAVIGRNYRTFLVAIFILIQGYILYYMFLTKQNIHDTVGYKINRDTDNRRQLAWNDEPSEGILLSREYIENLDRHVDTMDAPQLHSLPNYKSPCWYETLEEMDPYPIDNHLYTQLFQNDPRRLKSVQNHFKKCSSVFEDRMGNGSHTWRLRCLPYFYLIGINRGGSTSLWHSLERHPHLLGGPMKELHYWNEIRTDAGHYQQTFYNSLPLIEHIRKPRPLRAYIDLFDWSAEKSRRMTSTFHNGSVYHHAIIGEGTPNYLTNFDMWTTLGTNNELKEPRYMLAHILKMITPGAKIIATLRDPVDRLVSEYRAYEANKHKSTEEFHKLVEQGVRVMEECLLTRSLRSCVYDVSLRNVSNNIALKHGMYYPFVKDWMDVFKDQMLVIKSEDYYSAPLETVNRVLKFLGAISTDKVEEIDVKESVKSGKKLAKSSSPRASKRWKIFPETKNILRRFYRPYNQLLAGYLKDEGFLWR